MEKLAEGDAIFAVERMRRSIVEVTVCISYLVVNTGLNYVVMDVQVDVKKWQFSFSDAVCELQSWVKVKYKMNKRFQILSTAGGSLNNIINIVFVELRYEARVL